ncbi:paramyosin, long form-like [Rhagoletis pomonella]|uniref:paramyosin, long form-like n=1 Tax=Rhagoletis pomonella TaxID=28610 RepID=UPI0017845A75|nr:paramyosin, long form-like [Rhagoletis pomonella]
MSSSQAVRSSKYSYRATSTGPSGADISIEYSSDLAALSRLEDKIRLLQDDLEAERELRQRLTECVNNVIILTFMSFGIMPLHFHVGVVDSEVEVLIIDLEKSNNTCRELTKSVNTLEKHNIELKSRLDETIVLYENSQRDLKNKHADLQRTIHELDKVKDANNQLARENKKLGDDLHEAKATINEYSRRLHELELELRRLENERDELTAAYKEAEAGRKAEEQRAQRLSSEFNQYRHDTERRLAEKDEEIEAIRCEIVLFAEIIKSYLEETSSGRQCGYRPARI